MPHGGGREEAQGYSSEGAARRRRAEPEQRVFAVEAVIRKLDQKPEQGFCMPGSLHREAQEKGVQRGTFPPRSKRAARDHIILHFPLF